MTYIAEFSLVDYCLARGVPKSRVASQVRRGSRADLCLSECVHIRTTLGPHVNPARLNNKPAPPAVLCSRFITRTWAHLFDLS